MIWMIITKEEMTGPFMVFRFNEEALGRENIKLAVVDENDNLDFVNKGDIIISRTFNEKLLGTILSKGVRTTAEPYSRYRLVSDKVKLASFLEEHGILVPKVYKKEDIEEGKIYFVKPRFGADSVGIKEDCICKTKVDALKKIKEFEDAGLQVTIEEYIDGVDSTVSCIKTDRIYTYAIDVLNENEGGIQTECSKRFFVEYCQSLKDKNLNELAERIFLILGIEHHARIDFRRGSNGKYYLIDVNMLPGLGPTAHLAKSMLLSENISFIDAMKKIVESAK